MPIYLGLLVISVGVALGVIGALLPLKRGRRSDRHDIVRFQREMAFINRDRDDRLDHQHL